MGLLEQQYADGLLAKDPLTANPKMLAQALKARQQPRTQLTGQGLLDTAAIGLSPVPVIGDALGLAADFSRYINDPSSRTPLNFGLTALGALPFVPPAAAIFAGPLAKTAKLDQKAIAEGMEKAGRSRDDIWKETGWFKGPEGKWKFEIDDSGAFYRGSQAAGSGYLNDVMPHKLAYDAYPSAKNIRVTEGPLNQPISGNYNSSNDSISVFGKDKSSTTLHELQHAIQEREGFAKGGSPGSNGLSYAQLEDTAKTIYQNSRNSSGDPLLDQLFSGSAPLKPWEQMNKMERLGYMEQAQQDIYRRLAGEAEARAVQSRMSMNPQQRKETPPWKSYDMPWENLLVK